MACPCATARAHIPQLASHVVWRAALAEAPEAAGLRAKFEEMQSEERALQQQTRIRMQVFGMLYKAGHVRKDLKLRLWVMNGARVEYYKLGETEPRGSLGQGCLSMFVGLPTG
jgi:hypothetical protein